MEKQEKAPTLFSSDEYPNSGEDSDEDVVTDYLSTAQTRYSRVSVINGDLTSTNLHVNAVPHPSYTKDDEAVIAMSEESDDLHQHGLVSGISVQNPTIPMVPIINVTPHSSSFFKHYPVLEDNIQQLHEISDHIQRMRDLTLSAMNPHKQQNIKPRRTSSCPALSTVVIERSAYSHDHEGESDPDVVTICSTNSSPTHFPLIDRNRTQLLQGIDRRRSWTDVEDSKHNQYKRLSQNLLQNQNMRLRSISLSSLDSELDLDLDTTRIRNAVNSNRTSRSQTSTHSLNDIDFEKRNYKKVVSKKGEQRLDENIGLISCIMGLRVPLQKSVSTPSIVIKPPTPYQTNTETRASPSLTTGRRGRHDKGSGSETETEELHISHEHEFHEDLLREGTPSTQTTMDELLTDGTSYDVMHSEKTRRKRGSIFFRKKKDKNIKKVAQHHQWAPLSISMQGNFTCDVCMKSCSTKSAVHCENCSAMVHQSEGCKDHFQMECTKSKQSTKSSLKSFTNMPMSSSSLIVKRGSSASLPLTLSSGGSQTISEERDGDVHTGHRDITSGWDDIDFDDAHQFTLEDLDHEHPELGLGRDEPDSWSAAIGRSVAPRLVANCDREVKRQEHIYEFILTEKHHCLVLLAMDKIFVEGLKRHFNLNSCILERMFPKLHDLIEIHFNFLLKLRRRQSANPVVDTISDILIEQFSDECARNMKRAYGEFCSRHREAVDIYKYHQRHDARFARFVRHCQNNPLLKKKGIPECILFVTQRLTKYPLLVEPLIKTGVAPDEPEGLRNALKLVKAILGDVDACVADQERKDRKLEIYNRIDAKSYAMFRNEKFKKSDIMKTNRDLKFEGTSYLMQGRSKMVPIIVVVLSDVLFFLAETRDQKYVFFVPENKAGVVSLQKLLVREKAGQDSRGIYLISSNPTEPEMFELKVQKPKDKQLWIKAIRSAVEFCPQDIDSNIHIEDNNSNDVRDAHSCSVPKISLDEKQRCAKEIHMQNIVDELRKKDEEQASLFEQKIELHMRLLYARNVISGRESGRDKDKKDGPDYVRLVRGEGINSTQLWQEALDTVQEVMRLASSLSYNVGSTPLSRSLSSAGERHSEAYIPPAISIPRRAETFAGFDYNKERFPSRESGAFHEGTPSAAKSTTVISVVEGKEEEEDLNLCKDQREVALRLSHHVYTLLCIVGNQMTTIESLQAQIVAFKEGNKSSMNRPNSNRQLEELRNLQDQLSREKAEFRISSQQERSQMEEERAELTKWRCQLAAEQRDVEQQRDQLFRKLEALERQGVSLLATTGSNISAQLPHSAQTFESNQSIQLRKSPLDSKRVPLNLKKVQQLPVKQQLPLKLASATSNNNSR